MASSSTLRFKINVAIAVTFIVIAALFSGILMVYETERRTDALEFMEQSVEDLLEQHRQELANDIFSEHERAIKANFALMLHRELIVEASAYDLFGNPLASTNEEAAHPIQVDDLGTLLSPATEIVSFGDEEALSYTLPVEAYGETIGFCNIKHSLAKLNSETKRIIIIFAALLVTLLGLMTIMLNLIMARLVIRPVHLLQSVMQRLRGQEAAPDADVAEHFRSMIGTLQVMSDDLADSVAAKDEIGGLARSFDSMLEELRGTYAGLIEKERAQAEREAAEAAAEARREFLDNSGQGFLSFGTDLKVSEEYSRECRDIFNGDIAGHSIAALLHPADAHQEEVFARNLARIFNEENEYKRELYLSLMPGLLRLEDKALEAEYRPVGQSRMLLILTDVTVQKMLEDEVRIERNKLKFVVGAVRESRDFFGILDDFEVARGERIPELLSGNLTPVAALDDLYREIHTFKGLFAQQDFPHLPARLHELESNLSKIKQGDEQTLEDIGAIYARADLEKPLAKDIAIIEEVLGGDYMARRGEVALTKDQAAGLAELAEKILRNCEATIDDETRGLLGEVLAIQQTSLRGLLASYPKAVARLAATLEKDVKPFDIQGEDVRVDPEVFSRFTKTLVHVFRNAVDHGIEDSLEREEAGKPEEAIINCVVGKDEHGVFIEIRDDGRGLDPEQIRGKAMDRGALSAEEAETASEEQLLSMVFENDFSTNDTVTELSGRGVGLSAVRQELERLGGQVKIDSHPGRGTSFRFIIPEHAS